jgi:hypothetical protein
MNCFLSSTSANAASISSRRGWYWRERLSIGTGKAVLGSPVLAGGFNVAGELVRETSEFATRLVYQSRAEKGRDRFSSGSFVRCETYGLTDARLSSGIDCQTSNPSVYRLGIVESRFQSL